MNEEQNGHASYLASRKNIKAADVVMIGVFSAWLALFLLRIVGKI